MTVLKQQLLINFIWLCWPCRTERHSGTLKAQRRKVAAVRAGRGLQLHWLGSTSGTTTLSRLTQSFTDQHNVIFIRLFIFFMLRTLHKLYPVVVRQLIWSRQHGRWFSTKLNFLPARKLQVKLKGCCTVTRKWFMWLTILSFSILFKPFHPSTLPVG